MAAIISGKLVKLGASQNAFGGTEQLAERLIKGTKKQLFKDTNIILNRPDLYKHYMADGKNIFYFHDLPNDRMYKNFFESELVDKFSHFVFNSDYQKKEFCNKFDFKGRNITVIKNSINPIEIKQKKYDGKVNLIYHTTPHRGLELLAHCFPKILAENNNVYLKIFSSLKIYGWDDKDKVFEPLYRKLKDMKNVEYFSNVSNEEIRTVLINTHIFAYPNIWPESSCLAAIEAMSSKNLLVLPNLAALKETGSKSKFLYNFTNNTSEHLNTFQKQLNLAIQFVQKQSEDYKSHLDELKIYADNNHNLNEYLKKWERVLSNK
tara:strand:- start:212 stop:1171 length:960 start_codon:yes stop_codon:yes gene_type:complete